MTLHFCHLYENRRTWLDDESPAKLRLKPQRRNNLALIALRRKRKGRPLGDGRWKMAGLVAAVAGMNRVIGISLGLLRDFGIVVIVLADNLGVALHGRHRNVGALYRVPQHLIQLG